MKHFVLLCLALFFLFFKSQGQSNFELGFLPKVILSNNLSDKTKWVNSIESRTILYEDEFQLTHNLIDISSIISLKTALNKSFNFGTIIRFRNQEIIYRTFQHLNFINQISSIKIAHRIAFEQFYQPKKQTTFRTRYQINIEKPLNGERVDVKEFYLKIGNEYLYNFENNLEVRFTPNLGFRISKKDRIEMGFDYRVSEFLNNTTSNNLWFRTTWYVTLK